jgi:hypothetical protein
VAKFNLAFASLKPGDNFGWEDILVPIVIPGWINGFMGFGYGSISC